MHEQDHDLELRVLVLAPTQRDGAFTERLFRDACISTKVCRTMRDLCDEVLLGAAVVVIADQISDEMELAPLLEILDHQPTWSDIPVLVLVSPHSEGLRFYDHLRESHSVTYLKRPVEVVALLTAVQSGLRDRQRQYAVREHMIERERQSQVLMDADRRKDEFLATLAHELRNPLSPLRSGIDLLRMEDDDNADRQAVLKMMDRQLHHMVRLVDDLLDVSRITRDKLVLSSELVEVQTVLKTSIETTRQLINNSGITLRSEIPLEPVYVDGDQTRLNQVISNLLNNAVKYSNRDSEIELRLEATDDEVLISVQDWGIGIPPHMLGKVFDMFTQVDSSLTRARGGLGIGLTLVRRIVEMHGGSVTAMSPGMGQGSIFKVVLRRARAVVVDPNQLVGTDDKPANARRVLIVDDTRAARVMLSKLLRKLGHEVFEADSGSSALESLSAIKPNVVISDIGMPEMDGYELARCIRRRCNSDMPFLVALTGYGQESDRLKAADAGFDAHLIKPVNYFVLQQILMDAPITSR